jgi:hypothetical protein
MSSAQPLRVTAGLLPLPRPLMTGEVLDAAFRLFRAGLLRTLPYSGLAVLVLELPTLYWDFILPGKHDIRFQSLGYLLVLALSAALLGVITLRLHAISRGLRPRFRGELTTVLRRWLPALIATIGAVGLPVLLFGAASAFNNVMPTAALMVLAIPLLWPTMLLVVGLPAFWCDGLGPFASIVQAVRVSRRQSWRVVGALLATLCMIAVFYLLSAFVVGMASPLIGRADLFLLAIVSSMVALVVGAFGVPFVLAVLIVAYEDLKLREQRRPGVKA